MARLTLFVASCLLTSIAIAGEPKWIEGDSPIFPVISADRMVLSAYSAETSKWAQLKLERPLPREVLPTNQSGFVVIKTEDNIYAINAYAGQWANLKFVGKHDETFNINENFVMISDSRGMFMFGKKATKWEGLHPGTGELQKLEDEPATPPLAKR